MFFPTAIFTTLALASLVVATPVQTNATNLVGSDESHSISTGASTCFPAIGFGPMPSKLPSSNKGWWCKEKNEYAFLGFSYGVTGCTSPTASNSLHYPLTHSYSGQLRDQMKKEFSDIRTKFHGRYVRMYGTCDRKGF